MPIPYSEIRSLTQDSPLIDLFILDLINGETHRFCNEAAADGGALFLSGVPYYPLPVVIEGFGQNNTGAPQRPTISISNVSRELLSLVVSYGDMVGSTISRIRIFAKNLDGGSSPDPDQIFGPEKYLITKKIVHNHTMIQWEIAAPFDRPNTKLPIRQALRDPTSNSKGFPGLARRIR
ncbi:phage minor tail protein L [Xenophilus aerolatus]|nr:phage minor tail protein L [Xenophilus aerolatus]